jgi:hypothetical protein
VEERKGAYRVLLKKAERMRHLLRPRLGREDNIIKDLK